MIIMIYFRLKYIISQITYMSTYSLGVLKLTAHRPHGLLGTGLPGYRQAAAGSRKPPNCTKWRLKMLQRYLSFAYYCFSVLWLQSPMAAHLCSGASRGWRRSLTRTTTSAFRAYSWASDGRAERGQPPVAGELAHIRAVVAPRSHASAMLGSAGGPGTAFNLPLWKATGAPVAPYAMLQNYHHYYTSLWKHLFPYNQFLEPKNVGATDIYCQYFSDYPQ